MVLNFSKVVGVQPARDKSLEKSRFYYGASSTATASTGINWAATPDLLASASSTFDHIINRSTYADYIRVDFFCTAAASSFAMVKWNIDTTTITQTATISTAVLAANTLYTWVVPIGPREEMTFKPTTMTSGSYYSLYVQQANGV